MENKQWTATVLPNPDVERKQCVPECIGCNKMYSDVPLGESVLEDHVCVAYINPAVLHNRGGCALKSNKIIETIVKKKVNPIKASKRAKRG